MRLHQHVTVKDLREISYLVRKMDNAISVAQNEPVNGRVLIQKGVIGKVQALRDLGDQLHDVADVLESEGMNDGHFSTNSGRDSATY